MSSQRASAREAIATVGHALAKQSQPIMFVGGTVTALYPLEGGMALRPTLDVDCVVDLATTADYYAFVERLRALGFRECTDENAPLCRRVYGDIRVDIVATSATGIGPTNRWYRDVFAEAAVHSLESILEVRAITPLYFVATKLEAFRGRGAGDYQASHDLEDILHRSLGAPTTARANRFRGHDGRDVRAHRAPRTRSEGGIHRRRPRSLRGRPHRASSSRPRARLALLPPWRLRTVSRATSVTASCRSRSTEREACDGPGGSREQKHWPPRAIFSACSVTCLVRFVVSGSGARRRRASSRSGSGSTLVNAGQRCRVGKLRGDRRGVLLQQGLERREITAEPESDLPNLPRDGERVDASSDADEVLPE